MHQIHTTAYLLLKVLTLVFFVSIFTFHSRFLPIICKAVSSKSRTTRRHIFQFLEQILHVWPIHTLEGQAEAVQEALRVGISDVDPDTRCWARKAYWAFADHFRLEADSLLSSLDQAHKQMVEGDTSNGSYQFPWMSEGRSRQSSVNRSQDSLDGSRVGVHGFYFIDLLYLKKITMKNKTKQ